MDACAKAEAQRNGEAVPTPAEGRRRTWCGHLRPEAASGPEPKTRSGSRGVFPPRCLPDVAPEPHRAKRRRACHARGACLSHAGLLRRCWR